MVRTLHITPPVALHPVHRPVGHCLDQPRRPAGLGQTLPVEGNADRVVTALTKANHHQARDAVAPEVGQIRDRSSRLSQG